MMSELVFSHVANRDMEEIGDYIMLHLHNPKAALDIIQKIKKTVFRLKEFPEMGAPIVSYENQIVYRFLVCGNYLAFYHVDGESVYIDRVLYGHRDYISLLFGDDTEIWNEQPAKE